MSKEVKQETIKEEKRQEIDQDIPVAITRNYAPIKHVHSGSDTPKVTLEDLKLIGFWDDLITPGLFTKIGSSPPDLIAFGPSGNLLAYGFDGLATAEQVYFTVQLPHTYKQGTDLYPHIHWAPTDASVANVKWQMEYSIAPHTTGTFPAPTTVSVVAATSGVAWKHQKNSFPIIDGSDFRVSTIIVGRLFRNPGDSSDTYGSDAILLSIDFHYQVDSMGSRLEKTK